MNYESNKSYKFVNKNYLFKPYREKKTRRLKKTINNKTIQENTSIRFL